MTRFGRRTFTGRLLLATSVVALNPLKAFAAAPQRRADLVITSVQWSDDFGGSWHNNSVPDGSDVWFRAVVLNQGRLAWPSGVLIRVDFRVNGAVVSWSDTYANGLPRGVSVTLTADNGPDSDELWNAVTEGTYQIQAQVDSPNRIVEQSESNNTFSTSLVVEPPPVGGEGLFVAGGTLAAPTNLAAAVSDPNFTVFTLGNGYFNNATLTRGGITVQAQNAQQAFVTGNISLNADNVTIDGLRPTSGNVVTVNRPGCQVMNCLITGFGKSGYEIGIQVNASALNVANPVMISGNTLDDFGGGDAANTAITVGVQADDDFLLSSPAVTIAENTITNGGLSGSNGQNSAIQFFHPCNVYANVINNVGAGPVIQNKSHHSRVAYNRITNCFSSPGNFPALYNRAHGDNVWEYNFVENCEKGMDVYAGTNVVFRNNVFHNVHYCGQVKDQANIGLTVQNNTFLGWTGTGFYWDTSGAGVVSVNWLSNIFHRGSGSGTTINTESDAAITWDEDNNMYYLCTRPSGTSGSDGSSSSGIDPNFVGGDPFNFTPQAPEAAGRGSVWPLPSYPG